MAAGSAGGALATSGSRARQGTGSGFIEVEQKFLFGPGTAGKLVALGASLEGSVSFRDQYYDVPDCQLTLADHWLRQREGSGWELKCPPQPLEGARVPSWATHSATETPPCVPRAPEADHVAHRPPLQPLEGTNAAEAATQYLEVTCPREIVARVCELLAVAPDPSWWGNVATATKGLGLQEFASFVTQRHRYCLGDLNVDLDEADFGYAVGEVEAMVAQQEEVSEALQRIQTLGCQLGFDVTTRIPGKMSAYLYKFRPAHYNLLVQAGRLRRVKEATGGQEGKDSA